MQAGRDPDIQGPMGEDIPMQEQSAANTSSEGSATRISEPTVLTRLQQKKRAAKAQPEEPASADDQGAPAPQRVKLIPQKKRSQKNTATQYKANEQGADQQDSSPSPESARDTHAPPNPT